MKRQQKYGIAGLSNDEIRKYICELAKQKSPLIVSGELIKFYEACKAITIKACQQKLRKLVVAESAHSCGTGSYGSLPKRKRELMLRKLSHHILQQRDKPRYKRKEWVMPDGEILNSRELRDKAEREFPHLRKKLKTYQNFDKALEQIKKCHGDLIDPESNKILDWETLIERITGVKAVSDFKYSEPKPPASASYLKEAEFTSESGMPSVDIAWGIYKLKDSENDKSYIGITCRSFQERFYWHIIESKCKGVTEGSLAERLREIASENKSPEDIFTIEKLQPHRKMSLEEARSLEIYLIENDVSCQYPQGYNIRKGGSLGSAGNGVPYSMSLGDDKWYFDSLTQLTAWIQLNFPELKATYSKAVKRLDSGCSMHQALNIEPFYREQGHRADSFVCNGKKYRNIKKAADENKLNAAALKSKLHRAIRAEEPYRDLVRYKSAVNEAVQYKIPNPKGADGCYVSLKEFARLSGLSGSTVTTRYRSLRQNGLLAGMSERELVKYLSAQVNDRKNRIVVTLPDNKVVEGGQNEVTKKVCSGLYDSMRKPRYGISRAQRELSYLLRLNPSPDNKDLLRALGFSRKFT
ncbi:hypothetical protein [Endozoicomonas ascidiicola]|uniref:hypothetical protein n=1 Tax=Endozoicomonas ascidiicola TaxID=1698521 RepID=UPI000835973A|nr:hypothetical protein [Endozoicomonas ascidiicola]